MKLVRMSHNPVHIKTVLLPLSLVFKKIQQQQTMILTLN